jgi:hypothetical protein
MKHELADEKIAETNEFSGKAVSKTFVSII